jgi:hypothetical protein
VAATADGEPPAATFDQVTGFLPRFCIGSTDAIYGVAPAVIPTEASCEPMTAQIVGPTANFVNTTSRQWPVDRLLMS